MKTAKTVPNCPSTDFRWVCLLPDPVTGLDDAVRELGSREPKVWTAPNREYAVRLVRADLTPNTFRLSSVISLVDWEARKRERQRPKLSADPVNKARYMMRNVSERCLTCGAVVKPSACYCPAHRSWKARKRYVNEHHTDPDAA